MREIKHCMWKDFVDTLDDSDRIIFVLVLVVFFIVLCVHIFVALFLT